MVGEEQISKAQLRLTDIAEHLESDWIALAQQLGLTPDDISSIRRDYQYVVEQVCYVNCSWCIVCFLLLIIHYYYYYYYYYC